MRFLITHFYRFLNQAFDGFMIPLEPLGRTAEVLGVAITLGAVFTLVFKLLVDRERLNRARNDLRAALLEIWLYRRDPRLVLQAEKALMVANLDYLRAFFIPLAAALLLAAPLLLESHFRFALEPVSPGSEVLLTAELDPSRDRFEEMDFALSWTRGAGQISPPVREPSRHRVVWRLRPEGTGHHLLHLVGGGQKVDFPLYVGGFRGSVAPARAASVYQHLLALRNDPLEPDAVYQRIYVEYPRTGPGWLAWLTAGSLLAAFVTDRLVSRFSTLS